MRRGAGLGDGFEAFRRGAVIRWGGVFSRRWASLPGIPW
jgi:hypothetical protein